MVEIKYDKLVRDNIPRIINDQEEQSCEYYTIENEEEYFKYLVKKVIEEINEFYQTPTSEEMADVVEVLLTIGQLKKLDYRKIEKTILKKLIEKGGFKKKYILKKVVNK